MPKPTPRLTRDKPITRAPKPRLSLSRRWHKEHPLEGQLPYP
jgi:hypothetical protein